MPRDYYEILGVDRNATKADMKGAFRQLARQYHPDVSDEPDAEARFKEINEAYQILSDDNQRAAYDRFGHAGVNGGAGGFSGGFPGMEDIFDEIFGNFAGFGGGRRRRQGPAPGHNLRHDITIDFEQAIFGAEIDIDVRRQEACPTCDGSGAKPGTQPRTCSECGGAGQVRRIQQAFGFNMVNVTDCPRCRGKGKLIDTPCQECRGQGLVNQTRTLAVKIPPGVDDGMQIRLSGEGAPSPNGGPPGDLFVLLDVTPHQLFKRHNNDIVLEVVINVAQATLGDVISVPTVDGDTELTIPMGTQSGKVIRLRNKGVPKLQRDGTTAGRGDQLVVLTVEIPKRLTPEQRELFETLGRTLGSEVTPQKAGRGFRDRMADIFGGN